MLYQVDSHGCVCMVNNSQEKAIVQKRAAASYKTPKYPSLREKYVTSLEEAKKIIDAWVIEHS